MNKIRQIGSFAKVRRGASPRPISDPKYFGGTVGWVRIVDVTKHNYKYLRITEQYLSELGQSKSVTVEKGDLIMSICATVGKPIIVDMTACIHDGFVQLYDLDGVDTEYLFYQLQFNESKFERSGQPGTQVNLNTNIVENKQIWLPENLDKQLKIAKILSTIDRTIAKTEALIKKYQQIKAGLMHDLFTRGIGADGKLRSRREEAPELYRESAIGWIPKEWNCVNASEICYPVTKGTTPSFFEKSRTDESIPYIRVENLSFDGTLIFNNESLFISQYIQNFELQRSKIYPDDILINIVGPPLGKVSIVPDTYKDWNANQAIAIYRILNDINRDYLLYYLLSEFSSNWFYIRSKQTSGQVNLTLEMCNELKIPLPSESNEVIEISQRLSSLFEIIRSEKKRLSKLKKQKSGLMHDLLTGKVSINVDSDAP